VFSARVRRREASTKERNLFDLVLDPWHYPWPDSGVFMKDKWTKAAEELVEFCYDVIDDYDDHEEGKRDALKKAMRLIDRALKARAFCECGITYQYHFNGGIGACEKFKLDRSKTK